MSDNSLTVRAREVYTERGFWSLLVSSVVFVLDRIYRAVSATYNRTIEDCKRVTPSERRLVQLNDVTVPVDLYRYDRYVPFYSPAYPTEDDPLYEHVESEAIRTYAREGDDVVVVGGGLGVTTVVATRVTGGDVTVYEQSPDTFEILERTVEENDCRENVDLHCAAVGDPGSTNLSHKSPAGVETIPPRSLPDVDVYEMDCEGAETRILPNLEARPRILLVETHHNHDEVVEIIEDMGYEVVDVVEDGPGQHSACTHVRARRQ